MNEFEIQITGDDGVFNVLYGHRRLEALLEIGQKVEGVDTRTGKRYSIEKKDGSLVATEILVH